MSSTEPSAQPFTRQMAEEFISVRQFESARLVFDRIGPLLINDTARRFRGYRRALLTRNPENYGLYFVHDRARVPFLWLGMAWSNSDPPGTMPSWGASLEVDGPEVSAYTDGTGGLRQACEAVEQADTAVKLYHFPRHVELACWHTFPWLLSQADQPAALVSFWAGYLGALEAGEVPQAAARFIESLASG